MSVKTLFPEKLERLQYFIRLLIYFVSVAVIAAFLLPLTKIAGIPTWLPLVFIIPLILLKIPCLDIPRFRSIGWSPLLVLLFFIPLVNFVMQLLLFVIPPKQAIQTPSQLSGTPSSDWTKRNLKWFIPLLCLVALVCFGGMMALGLSLMKSSDAYSGAVARAQSSPAVMAALGTPIKDGIFFAGNISENNTSGSANLVIPISGPKGTANLYVSASRSLSKWHFDDLVVEIHKTKQRIDILDTNELPVATPASGAQH